MRILVIEDHQHVRDSLQRTLNQAGYTVDASADGAEGLWYAKDGHYACIILDLMLPEMDGRILLQELRASQVHTPVLILSARDSKRDQIEGLDLGADDYMTKPFLSDELLARVRALTRRAAGASSNVLICGRLKIDQRRREARVAQQVVPLTPREFAILQHLALHVGTTIDRDVLRNQVFAFDDDVTSNVIDQWIARIRKKLAQCGLDNPIETKRGAGYCLIEGDNGA